MKPRLFHLHALSALHCGTGQSAGVVDLPIARERATNLPMVPGSSLRGVLRECDEVDEDDVAALFGPRNPDGDAKSFAGACAIGDAALLTLPVRSLAGVVCYATSPFILKRYARRAGFQSLALPETESEHAIVTLGSVNQLQGKVVLEDLDLTAREDAAAQKWANVLAEAAHADGEARKDFASRFAILPDDVMDFLSETGTEVRARIAINPETGTVKDGALWYEENLPADSLLWGMFAVAASSQPDDPRGEDELAKALPDAALLQLGGKAGVGRGLVRFRTSRAAA